MIYVLDASVALKWVLPEVDSAKAKALRADHRKRVHQFIAPDVFLAEVAHSLVRAERRGIVAPGNGQLLLADLTATIPQLHATLPLLPAAFAMASALRISLYDSLYVTLAEREGCELVTADIRLVNALQQQFPFVVPLAAMP